LAAHGYCSDPDIVGVGGSLQERYFVFILSLSNRIALNMKDRKTTYIDDNVNIK
jgi:hypothetical protein